MIAPVQPASGDGAEGWSFGHSADGELSLARQAKAPLELVLVLGGLTALAPLSIDMYLPALPALSRSMAASPTAAQLTVTVFFVGIALGQLAYGPLSDRCGRRPPILAGLALYVLESLGCALAPNISILLAARVIQAVGGSSGAVVAQAIVRDRFQPDEMLHVFSLLMLVLGLSPIFAPLLGSWTLMMGSWRLIFGVQVIVGLILAALVGFRLMESRSDETRRQAQAENAIGSYVQLLSQRRLWRYLLTGALSGAALFTYIASSPDVLINRFHVNPQLFGWIFGVNGAALILATQANARLARRIRPDVLLGWAIFGALAFAIVPVIDSATGIKGLFGILVPLFLIMGSLGFTQGNASAGAMSVKARRSGATASLSGSATFAAGAVCGGLTGLLRDGSARPMAMAIAASLAMALLAFRGLASRSVVSPPEGSGSPDEAPVQID